MYRKLSSEEETLIKWGVTDLRFQSKAELSEVLKFKSALNMAVDKIESSLVTQFKKILNMTMDVITSTEYKEKYDSGLGDESAIYNSSSDQIYIFLDRLDVANETAIGIIHELAHRFHNLHIKDGLKNRPIWNLFQIATNKTHCEYTKTPRIGDPLTDLNIDERGRWEWTNKMANLNDYFLKKSTHYAYIYENSAGEQIVIDAGDITDIIKCPTGYGSRHHTEFFAEMLTLITINKVKPSQKLMADKFLEIVQKNLK